MKGNLFIQIAGIQTKVAFDSIIKDQANYGVLDDCFLELFSDANLNKMKLQPKITDLLEILDLWNYAHKSERKFWTLKDATHPLQQIEIPIRNFIKTFAHNVNDKNWELAKDKIESLSVIVSICTFQDAYECNDEDEGRQRDLLLRLAGLSFVFSNDKNKQEDLSLQKLGETFAKLFIELNEHFDFNKVKNEEYELFNFQREGFLAFKTLARLGFTSDLANKLLDHKLVLSDQDKSQKVLKLFEHPQVLSKQELERLYKAIKPKEEPVQGVSSTALGSGSVVPNPPPPPEVTPGPLSCAFLGVKTSKGHHR